MGAPIDLRSDTVTRPTPAMRRAMADAEVGDDGYGEDPTVRRLEEVFAERVGKQAALYVPSGTMGNQIALRVLGRPGTAVIAGRRQHVVLYEQGAAGVNGWIVFHTVADHGGALEPATVAELIAGEAHHWLPVSAVCVENTHMPAGGMPWSLDRLRSVVAAAGGRSVHLDGARLFNAEVATGIPAADFAAPATTVMCCLSKGLGAPVGSMLAGSAEVIEAARLERKRLGGAMRQAGVIAAAGLIALTTMVERLADDHARAARLARAVAERWPDGGLDPASVRTNCVVFGHDDPQRLLDHLAGEGVLAGSIAPGVVRLMTHLDVDDEDVDRAAKALATAPEAVTHAGPAVYDERPARALAVYAHPDDPEVSCGGTLARWADAGAEVHLVVCNSGDKGSSEPGTDPVELVEARAAEVEAAAEVMRLAGHELLGIPDGELDNSVELRGALVARIRRLRPEVVVAPDPTAVFFGDSYVNHHDHRALGWATLDACAPMASSPLYFPAAGPAHRVSTLLLSGTLEPDCWVDIGTTLRTKLAAVACHRSQLPPGDDADELIEEVVRVRAEEAGEAAGLRLAEGFRRIVLGT